MDKKLLASITELLSPALENLEVESVAPSQEDIDLRETEEPVSPKESKEFKQLKRILLG